MPVVVAIQTPKPGRLPDVLAAFEQVSPLVHQEAGCELYAVHTDGEVCVVVERWTTHEDLQAHADGEPLRQLMSKWVDALSNPYDVWILDNLPMGTPVQGTIQ